MIINIYMYTQYKQEIMNYRIVLQCTKKYKESLLQQNKPIQRTLYTKNTENSENTVKNKKMNIFQYSLQGISSFAAGLLYMELEESKKKELNQSIYEAYEQIYNKLYKKYKEYKDYKNIENSNKKKTNEEKNVLNGDKVTAYDNQNEENKSENENEKNKSENKNENENKDKKEINKKKEYIESLQNQCIPINRSGKKKNDDMKNIVKRVVGDTIEAAFDPNKDIILKQYSPTCYNCQNLEFIWQAVAKEFYNEGINDIVFMNIDGEENYIRGQIDSKNEGKFPHIILLPKGEQKKKQFEQSCNMVEQLASYYNTKIRQEQDQIEDKSMIDKSIIDTIIGDKEEGNTHNSSILKEPNYSKDSIPIVGCIWDMKWGKNDTIIKSLLDFIELNSKTYFNKDAIYNRIIKQIPIIRENIYKAAEKEFLDPSDRVVINDPCGRYIELAFRNFYTATLGLSDPQESTYFMVQYRKCVQDNSDDVQDYYNHIQKHIDFVQDCYDDKSTWLKQDNEQEQSAKNIIDSVNTHAVGQ